MKKYIFLYLVFIIPALVHSQTLFRSGTFLHHSTGLNIWGPNGSSTSILQEIDAYNAAHGYTGTNAISMTQQWWPSGGDNEWEYWHRIFDNQVPGLNIFSVMNNNKIVVIKSCFPSSEMTGMGQPSDTLTYTIKSVYNYKWHWRHIINVMAQHPDNFFAIWTNAPLTQASTNPTAAQLTKQFTTWAKDTLAMGLDPEMGAFPPNVYVFHYFSKLTDENGYEMLQYAISSSDSHPNANATALVAPQFVNEIFDAAIAYEQGGAVLNITPLTQNLSASAGSVNFSVTTTLSWTAQSNSGWCTVTPSGTGNGTLTASCSENTSTSPRTATITITATGAGSQTVSVVQAGMAASMSVSPQNQNVSASSGSAGFSVTANTAWTAQSNAGWCTVTPSGSGNATLTATYTANTSTTTRVATITLSANGVSDQTVTLTQAGMAASMSVSPSNQNVAASSGNATFSVTANVAWTAQSNAGWCTVTPSGTGNGSLTASYTANTGTSVRTATITVTATGVSNQTVTVTQSGTTLVMTVSPSNQNVPASSGNTTFSVNSNVSWTALSNADWCIVTPSGNGNSTITCNYTENLSIVPRIATLTISADGVDDQVVTVTQAGAAATLSVSPLQQNVSAASGSVGFSVLSNTNWTAQSDAGWCTVTPSGSGNGTLSASYTENTGTASRTATITVSGTGTGDQTVTVMQIGSDPAMAVSPVNQNVSAVAGSTQFAITSNTNWTAESDAPWCTVTPSGSGSGVLLADFTENINPDPRIASIVLSVSGLDDQTVTVTQAGSVVTLAVSPENQNVAHTAGSTQFAVNSNADWTAVSDAGWCTVTGSGSGSGSITASFTENTVTTERIATLTVSAGGVPDQVVTVTQFGAEATLAVSPPSQQVSSAAGNTSFSVLSNSAWMVHSDVSWCMATPSGTGDGTIVAAYDENHSSNERTASLKVTVNGANPQTVYVVQAGVVTGVEENSSEGIRIYPNPSDGKFTLATDNGGNDLTRVIISDVYGKICYDHSFNGAINEVIDLGKIGKGIYNLILTRGSGVLTKKMVIR